MTDIKVPITAPGAKEAAEAIDRTSTSVRNLADAEKVLLDWDKKMAAEREKARQAEHNFQMVIRMNAAQWSRSEDAMRRNTTALRDARREMDAYQRSARAGDSLLSKRAERKLLNMIPGGRVIDDIGDVAEGVKGGGRLAAGFGVLTVALLAGAAVFRANSQAVERANEAMLNNIKVNNDMARQSKATFDAQQADASKSFGSIRNAARFILGSQGRQGEGDIAQALNLGGPDAVNALAEALKSKSIKRSGLSGAGLLMEAQQVSDVTGTGLADVLKEFSKQKGRFSADKTIKELTGGISPELWAMFSEQGLGTAVGGQLTEYDAIQARLTRERAGKTMNRGLVLGGAMNELDAVMNPFKKAVDDHNAKIREEIAARDALIMAQRSMVDFWIENMHLLYGPLDTVRKALGVESVAEKAARERKSLLKQLR